MNRSTFLSQRATRIVPSVQVRTIDNKPGRFAARVIHYDVVDDYRTLFAPKVFEQSLQARMPRIVWGHDWTDPIGRWTDREDTPKYLDLIGDLDLDMIMENMPAVPRAHQAYAQLQSGTIDQFSVGFMPEDGEEQLIDGVSYFRFTRARLDEVSLVLVGAVPNTELLALRSRSFAVRTPRPEATIPADQAAQILLDLHTGQIDLADALTKIKTSTVVVEPTTDEGANSGEGANSSDDGAGGGDSGDGAGGDGDTATGDGDAGSTAAPPAEAGDPEAGAGSQPEVTADDFSDVEAILADLTTA